MADTGKKSAGGQQFYKSPKPASSAQKLDAMEYWVPDEPAKNSENSDPRQKDSEKKNNKNGSKNGKANDGEKKQKKISTFDQVEYALAGCPEPCNKIGKACVGLCRRFCKHLKSFLTHTGLINNNKVAPITSKVQSRHLELEPLCCISSCLVRGGCTAVVSFEVFHVVASLLCILARLYHKGQLVLWSPFEANFNACLTHQIFLYIVLAFDVITALMAAMLCRGLLRFDKNLLIYHYRYDFFALAFNIVVFFLYALAISSKGPSHWDLTNSLLVICFAIQIPLQLWAISVVKSCADFFALIQVFVSLAET